MRQIESWRSYFTGDRKIELLVCTLACLVVADGVITQYLIANGFGFEANPFLRVWIMRDNFLLLKLIGGLLAALMLWDMHKRHLRTVLVVSSCLVTWYTAIVFWNLFSLYIAQV